MILIFYLIKIMHILMKKEGCLIPLPLLKSGFSWEIWNMDFLYVYIYVRHRTLWTKNILKDEVLKVFSLVFLIVLPQKAVILGGMSSLYLLHEFSWRTTCVFQAKCSSSWFWYWLLSRAALKSAEPFGIKEKKLATIWVFKDDTIQILPSILVGSPFIYIMSSGVIKQRGKW